MENSITTTSITSQEEPPPLVLDQNCLESDFLVDANGNTFAILVNKKYLGTKQIVAIADRDDVDGVVFLNKSEHCSMRIYDRDGTFENMCGNALRATTLIAKKLGFVEEEDEIITDNGPKRITAHNNKVKVLIGDAKSGSSVFDIAGVPHLVINSKPDPERDRALRTLLNANITCYWVENGINYRTYEVGVENYTKSCGTGAVAVTHALGLEKAALTSAQGRLFVEKIDDDYYLSGEVICLKQTHSLEQEETENYLKSR